MRAALIILAATALFISGCENTAEQKFTADNPLQPGVISSQAAQAAAQADETLKTVTAEAAKTTEELNKRLPSIIENLKKLITILDKEAKTLQKELDKLPKQPTTTGAPSGQGTSNPVAK